MELGRQIEERAAKEANLSVEEYRIMLKKKEVILYIIFL
jgi:hypothetical protein